MGAEQAKVPALMVRWMEGADFACAWEEAFEARVRWADVASVVATWSAQGGAPAGRDSVKMAAEGWVVKV